jgi:hypothetical protein
MYVEAPASYTTLYVCTEHELAYLSCIRRKLLGHTTVIPWDILRSVSWLQIYHSYHDFPGLRALLECTYAHNTVMSAQLF